MTANIMERQKGNRIDEYVSDHVAFDFETTGKNINSCEIIEIGAVKVRGGEITDTFSQLVKPVKPVPKDVSQLTGITNEMLEDKPCIEDVMESFIKFIGTDVLVGHNITTFDLNILYDACLALYGMVVNNDYADTMYLARYGKQTSLGLPNVKMSTLCEYYGITNEAAHRALSDAIASHEVYTKLFFDREDHSGFVCCKAEPMSIYGHAVSYNDVTCKLRELKGLLGGVISDNKVNDDEVYFVYDWLQKNEELKGNFPFDLIYEEIEKVLEDGVIDFGETQHLLKVFTYAYDPVSCSDDIPCSRPESFYGKNVCVTGEFSYGEREKVESYFEQYGIIICANVKKSVDYLVVGAHGSEAWAGGNYGGKIKKAVEYQKKGAKIKLITEQAFFEMLKNAPMGEEAKQLAFIEIEEDGRDILDHYDSQAQKLKDLLSAGITEICAEQGVDEKYITYEMGEYQKGDNKGRFNGCFSMKILDPLTMNASQRIFTLTIIKNSRGNRYEVDPFAAVFDKVPVPCDGDVKQYPDKSPCVWFAPDSETVTGYLLGLISAALRSYTPTSVIGCCSRYNACSDAKKCIHPDLFYARICSYRKNLEAGRIFYGKNCNV